jgi:hypothetical protein
MAADRAIKPGRRQLRLGIRAAHFEFGAIHR